MGKNLGKNETETTDLTKMKLALNKETKYLLVIVVSAVILRTIGLNQSLWLDESIGALVARDYSYEDITKVFLHSDNHPPLYYFLLKLWSSIFGYSEIALRSLSVIFGVGVVILGFMIVKTIDAKADKQALLTSLLIATSPILVYYSQEARMYMPITFLSALVIYLFLRTSSENSSKINWVLFSTSLVLLIATDYVPVFLIPVFWLFSILSHRSISWWKLFLLSHLPLIAFAIVWAPVFEVQRQKGRWLLDTLPKWADLSGGANLKQVALFGMKSVFGRISFVNKTLYYVLVISAAIPYAVGLAYSFKRKNLFLIWLWFLIPPFLGFIISFVAPVFIYFRFIYVLPAFYILVSFGAYAINKKKFSKIIVCMLIVVNLTGWLVYIIDESQHRENWRDAVAYTDVHLGPKDLVLFSYPDAFAPYRWYSKKLIQSHGATDSISANSEPSKEKVVQLTNDISSVYYYNYLSDLSDPDKVVESTLIDQDFEFVGSTSRFVGVGEIRHYQR